MKRIEKIPNLEAKFENQLVDSSGKSFKRVNPFLKGVNSIRPSNFSSYFYGTKVKKTQIVLHFTAGVLSGDMAALTKQFVSVPYVVARSGTTFELFNPDYWSYHLGSSKTYSNKDRSSSSLGIEISNIGPLVLKDDGFLYDVYGVVYCHKDDTAFYDHLATPYRGYSYFASYTEEQYTSLKALIDQLVVKYDIAKELLPEDQRFITFEQPIRTGIVSHVHYRADKFDLAPNFKYEKIL